MSVGLDIGSNTIKVVELIKERKKAKLKASGIIGHSGKLIGEATGDKDLAIISDTLKKLFKEAKISSKDVAVALPETQAYTRTIKFPLLSDAEIASAVRWEAEQYIPISLSEAIVQHQIIEKREDVNPPMVLVLLVAAPKTLVNKYARLVENAGLNLVVLETELMSLVRSLAPEDQSVLVVDFGAKSTDIAVSRKGVLTFSRSIPTAGEALTRAVARGLGVEENMAEEYKKTYGLLQKQLEGKVRMVLEPVFRIVADEMKKVISYYQSEEKGDAPKSVILSGGSAGMPELASVLANLLGMEVVVGNPFAKIEVDPEAVKSLAGYAQLYSVAAGLALRNF